MLELRAAKRFEDLVILWIGFYNDLIKTRNLLFDQLFFRQELLITALANQPDPIADLG